MALLANNNEMVGVDVRHAVFHPNLMELLFFFAGPEASYLAKQSHRPFVLRTHAHNCVQLLRFSNGKQKPGGNSIRHHFLPRPLADGVGLPQNDMLDLNNVQP